MNAGCKGELGFALCTWMVSWPYLCISHAFFIFLWWEGFFRLLRICSSPIQSIYSLLSIAKKLLSKSILLQIFSYERFSSLAIGDMHLWSCLLWKPLSYAQYDYRGTQHYNIWLIAFKSVVFVFLLLFVCS